MVSSPVSRSSGRGGDKTVARGASPAGVLFAVGPRAQMSRHRGAMPPRLTLGSDVSTFVCPGGGLRQCGQRRPEWPAAQPQIQDSLDGTGGRCPTGREAFRRTLLPTGRRASRPSAVRVLRAPVRRLGPALPGSIGLRSWFPGGVSGAAPSGSSAYVTSGGPSEGSELVDRGINCPTAAELPGRRGSRSRSGPQARKPQNWPCLPSLRAGARELEHCGSCRWGSCCQEQGRRGDG